MSEIADAMCIPIRTYHNLEAGRGHPTLETIVQFASTTKADPFAVIAAAFLNIPSLAIDCADNHYALISIRSLSNLHRLFGSSISGLTSKSAVEGFTMLEDHFAKGLTQDLESFEAPKIDLVEPPSDDTTSVQPDD